MLIILVIISFFAAIYYTYLAVENFRIFEYGTHAVAFMLFIFSYLLSTR